MTRQVEAAPQQLLGTVVVAGVTRDQPQPKQCFGQTAPIPERLPHLQTLFELRRRLDEIKLFGSERAGPIQGSRAGRGVAA